jgi:peptidoglycan/LPS O-acetylase OafA/YrhL
MPKVKLRLDFLDLIRGLAALLVLGGHLRAYIFESYALLDHSNVQAGIFAKFFFFVTGLGHQAVMVFFALSGFLVGGKALVDISRRQFLWSLYILRRLTRLWIVIIPSIILTMILDTAGISLTHGTGYDGRYYDLYSSGPHSNEGVDLCLSTLLGNLVFMQGIAVHTFGTNGPMWSLANEFWYYIVFPLAAWVALARVPLMGRFVGLVVLFALVKTLPIGLLEDGAIWVAGAAAAWLSCQSKFLRIFCALPVRILALSLFVLALVVSKFPEYALGDLGLGIAVAFTLPIFAHLPSPGGLFTAVTRFISEISYTLYLTHFPFLSFIVLSGVAPTKWQPGVAAAGIYIALILGALIWASAIWWCFERNTDRAFKFLRDGYLFRKGAAINTL